MKRPRMEVILRVANEQGSFPWLSNSVPLILIDFRTNIISQAKTLAQKRDMMDDLLGVSVDDFILLAPWPGQWSQDVFHITDPAPLVRALHHRFKTWVGYLDYHWAPGT